MSPVDVFLREGLLTYTLPSVILGLVILILLTDSTTDVRKRFSAWLMKDFTPTWDTLTTDVKTALFADLGEIVSRVVDLRNKGVIRILEIGVGTGSNLKYYPQQCRLVVVDPTFYFHDYYKEHRDKFPDIVLEKFVLSAGEKLKSIPSNSVDVVVTTAVLCSVDDVRSVLRETRRVLVPHGRYYFLEHMLDEYSHKRSRLQGLLTRCHVWPWLLDGCKFLPIRETISNAGFSSVDYKEFSLEFANIKDSRLKFVVGLMSPHIVGVARK